MPEALILNFTRIHAIPEFLRRRYFELRQFEQKARVAATSRKYSLYLAGLFLVILVLVLLAFLGASTVLADIEPRPTPNPFQK